MSDDLISESDKKAGYNQSFGITELLINLTGSYITSISQDNLLSALESIQRIVDIISPKLKDEELKPVDFLALQIMEELPRATQTYNIEGKTYLVNPEQFRTVKYKLSKLYREVNKLQDKHGYGMIDADDPKLAIYE